MTNIFRGPQAMLAVLIVLIVRAGSRQAFNRRSRGAGVARRFGR